MRAREARAAVLQISHAISRADGGLAPSVLAGPSRPLTTLSTAYRNRRAIAPPRSSIQHRSDIGPSQSPFERHGIQAAPYSSRIPGASRPSRVRTRDHASPTHHRQKPHPPAATTRADNSASSVATSTSSSAPPEHAAESSTSASTSSSRPRLDHATVLVPLDESGASVIDSSDALRNSVSSVLGQPALVVTREIEMLNVFMGFEQANKYAIVTPGGQQVGYLAEQEVGMLGGTLKRQFLKTHRPFEAHVLDLQGRVIMSIKRGLTWINSRTQIYVVDPDTAEHRLVGEVQQIWHPWRRKYELFVDRQGADGQDNEMVQFASIDGALLTWDFVMTDEASRPLGAISRNFRGFGREIFTDTGQYVLSFDPTSSPELRLEAPQSDAQKEKDGQQSIAQSSSSGRELVESGPARALGMDERAVALATAISADFDYFSRHSSQGHGGMFPFFWMGGGGSQAEPAAGGEGGAQPPAGQQQDSSDVQASPSAPGTEGGGLGPAVGTGIGYEMMGGGRQGREQGSEQDGQSSAPGPSADTGYQQPSSNDPYGDQAAADEMDQGWGWGQNGQDANPSSGAPRDLGTGQEDVWGDNDPWGGSSPPSDGGGGGWGIGDFFGGGD